MKGSPWGAVQDETHVAEGIEFVSTASHGGMKLSPDRNQEVPEYMRIRGGWYEEDLEVVLVITVFPKYFSEEQRTAAERDFRNYYPVAYQRFYKTDLGPEDSRALAEETFDSEHRGDYIGMAAWGDWHKAVPEGQVLVFAGRGGRLKGGSYPKDTAYFFVPKGEYNERSPFGFVVDEERHERTDVRP